VRILRTPTTEAVGHMTSGISWWACDVPAAGFGNGITGIPIAHGVVGWALFGLVVVGLVVVTAWLMRRWSQPAPSVAGGVQPAIGSALDYTVAEKPTCIESAFADRELAVC